MGLCQNAPNREIEIEISILFIELLLATPFSPPGFLVSTHLQGLANDEELISSSLHKTVKHQERVSSPEAPPTKRSKTDEVSSYNRCLPPSKTIKIREELVKKNEMKKQTLIKKIKL
uniref:Naringenin,2-oxoglutarate 3-dioxygenase n=1 Tax=Lygus hesperus TaxID=30085 RepID=A0A0A9X7H0_LYGHE